MTQKNSVFKKSLSVFLTVIMLFTTISVGIILPDTKIAADAAERKSAANYCGDLIFIVPETIYLTPVVNSWKDNTSSSFQYYINNTTSNTTKSSKDSTGLLYYVYSGASTATLSYKFYNSTLSSEITSGGSVTTNLTNNKMTSGTSHSITGGTSPTLGAAVSGYYIEWCITFNDDNDRDNDNNPVQKKAYAYTYVYKPYTVPVAGATRAHNTDGVGDKYKGYAQSIGWISGFHAISGSGNRYMKYGLASGAKTFSAFLSSDTGVQVSRATTVNTSQKYLWVLNGTFMKAAFYNSNASASYFYAAKSSETPGCGDWLTDTYSAGNTFSVKNATYENKEGGDANIYALADVAPHGTIVIDTSRYTNLDQIPNLGVGYMVTDNEQADGNTAYWLVADMTGIANNYSSTGTSANSINGIANAINTKIAGCGTGRDNSNNGNDSPGVYYTGTWPKDLTSDATKEYKVKCFYVNENNDEFHASASILHLDATQYNKGALRAAVKSATKIMAKVGVNGATDGVLSSMYFDADNNYKWLAFQTAYKNAVIALTKVDGTISDLTGTVNALNNAIKGLCTKVTVNGNGGTLTGTTSEWLQIGTTVSNQADVKETYDYTPTCTAKRTGYTFKGWDVNPDCDPALALSTVPVGYNDTVYAIWEINLYNVKFVRQVPTDDDEIVLSTTDYDVKHTFTFPATASADYYTFDDQWEVISKTEDYWTVGNSFGAGNTSALGAHGDVKFRAKFTPIEYSITFDPKGGSAVNDQNLIKYNYTTNTALPEITKVGYTFTGWRPKTVSGSWDPSVDYTTIQKMHGNVELVAQWATVHSTVTLELAEDESIAGSKTLSYAFSSNLQLNNPTKLGYKFKGWKVKSFSPAYTTEPAANRWVVGHEYLLGSEANVILPSDMLGNVTLVPIWEKETYTVTYGENDGTPCAQQSFTITDSFNLATTTRNGYTFAGWTVSAHGDPYNWTASTYNGGQTVSGMYGNVTLTANWTQIEYTVTLDVNGGDALAQTSLTYKTESATELPVPTRTGYDFVGWKLTHVSANSDWATYTGRPTDGIYRTNALPSGHYGSLTLTAEWNHTKYTITYVTSDTNVHAKEYYIDDGVFYLIPSSRAGYSFRCWKVNANAGNWVKDDEYTVTTPVENKYGNVSLTEQFDPITYTIIYQDTNGTQIGNAQNYTIEDTLTVRNYSANGYSFSKWQVVSADEDCGWSVGSTIAPGEHPALQYYGNVVLQPVRNTISYSITFDPNGGSAYPAKTYTIESTDVLPGSTKTGYDFAGWLVTSAAGNWIDGAVYNAGTSLNGKYGSIELAAQWNPKQYAITYIVGDTALYPSGIVKMGTYDQNAPDLTDDEKAKPSDAQYDYAFSHWSPELGRVTGETTYTAVYDKTLRSYDITWMLPVDLGGSFGSYSAAATNTVDYGVTPVYNNGVNPTLDSLTPDDYSWRFIGWATTPNGTPVSPVPAVTGTATYYAIFELVQAPEWVHWVINGETTSELWGIDETPVWNHDVPSKPDANGYKFVFSGWDPTPVPVEIDHEYTYTAQFTSELQTYTYAFNVNSGEMSEADFGTYRMGDAVTFPTPVKTGYVFTGWRLDAPVGTWTAGTVIPAGDYVTNTLWGNVSFTAQWSPVTYHITYNKSTPDDIVPGVQEYTIESTACLGTASREGYDLVGWTVSTASGNWVQGTRLAPDFTLNGSYGNVTLTPVWQVKVFTIYWISGDITQESAVEYGSAIITFPPSARMGYTADWNAEVPATMPAHDLTFTAVYTPVEYYVRINANGGSDVESFYYTINGNNTLPTPTREGADFAGWKVTVASGNWSKNTVVSGGASLNGKYGNVTLTAQWNMHTCTVIWNAGDITKTTVWFYGALPSFDGIPRKSPDDHHSYVFIGWDKDIVPVTEDEVVYTALFEETERIYTVTWNIDGATSVQEYSYGEMPVYSGPVPVRASTTEYDFTFAGWSPTVSEVTRDITYVAQFDVFTKLLGLSLDVSSAFLDLDGAGGEKTLNASVYPSNATVRDIRWTSLTPAVASVDAVGKVSAVSAGVAVIKVSSVDGRFNSYCVVTVNPRYTKTVVVSANGISTTQLPGAMVQLTATIQPDNATDSGIVWTSSDPTVATVADGMVTFLRPGTATISALASDGYSSGSIVVTTTQDAENIDDQKKTYRVDFADVGTGFMLEGIDKTFNQGYLMVPEGENVRFRLSTYGLYVTVNGKLIDPDNQGWYTIYNVDKNYAVVTLVLPVGIPDEDPGANNNNTDKLTFFQRLQQFFRRIVEFFRGLFK